MSIVEAEAPLGALEVAHRLRIALAARNLTQSELARRLAGAGASRNVVNSRRRLLLKWLSGEHAPTLESAAQLAAILETPANHFLVIRDADHRRASETVEAIEYARATTALNTPKTARTIRLPLDASDISRIVPTFNPDKILLHKVTHLVPGTEGRAEVVFHPDTAGLGGYWWEGTGLVSGILQVEAIAQLAALVLLTQPENANRAALNAGWDKTRLRQPLKVGMTLDVSCRVKQMRGPVAHIEGRGAVGEVATVETNLTLVID